MSAFDKAFSISKRLGIDECEVISSQRNITTIRITDSNIAEVKQNFEKKIGIRLIHQKQIVGTQTNDEGKIESEIENSLKSTFNLKSNNFWKSLPCKERKISPIKGTFDEKLVDISASKAADIAQEMINSSTDEKVTSISGSLNIVSETFKIANSHGIDLEDTATYISGIINADSECGNIPVSGMGHQCCRTLDEFAPTNIGTDAKIMCVESINPKHCDEDTYSIIFEPYSVGELLSFVFSSNFSLKTFSEKKSCFTNNFKEKIAVDEFNLVDDPHVKGGIGSKSFDDEGSATFLKPLIRDGIFCGLFSDSYNAFKQGETTGANALRQGLPMGRSTQPIPIPAPHNMKVEPGSITHEDIIRDTKCGLLVGRLWYTYAVNPIKGDFSCTARSGIRMIKDGQIKHSIKPVRIVHSLPKMLKNISAIGNNSKNVLQWASLPSISPSIRVEKIRVNPI